MPVGLAAMTRLRPASLAGFVAALCFLSASPPAAAQTGKIITSITVRGAGSTFASLLYKKWIEEYRSVSPQVSVTYDPVGSGEGIRKRTRS
jgi:ABC-type phosphate transport system substrate-binding protein